MELPLHPAVVHFPIALFVSALGFELASFIFKKELWHQMAWHLYFLAALTSPLAVWTGLQEAKAHQLHHRVLDIHRAFALVTMWFSLSSLLLFWFLKKRKPQGLRIAFLICLFVLLSSVAITAYHGGRMVYEYGIGIEQ